MAHKKQHITPGELVKKVLVMISSMEDGETISHSEIEYWLDTKEKIVVNYQETFIALMTICLMDAEKDRVLEIKVGTPSHYYEVEFAKVKKGK